MMLTIGMLVGATFAVVTTATALKPHIGGPVGCVLPILAFVASIVVIIFWPSGSSTDVFDVFWVPIWVACGAWPGLAIGIGLRVLFGRPV